MTAEKPATPEKSFRVGLSGKLLLLTVLFVLLAEVLIFVPSIANVRSMWLMDRVATARLAVLALDATPDNMVPQELARRLLDGAGARAIAVKFGNARRLLTTSDMPAAVDDNVDLRDYSSFAAIRDALITLASRGERTVRVIGDAPMGGDSIEVILPERPLYMAMISASQNILLVSLLISVITASLVYAALSWLFVRPLRRMTVQMMRFAQNPEDASRILTPSRRADEIGLAERELARMQYELSQTLHQKSRLAALGLAVSKINHDLRNLLSSAQLLSDRIADLREPLVRQIAPKLMRALDRAISYCQQTLAYGKAQEPLPERKSVDVHHLVEEVRDTLSLGGSSAIGWVPSIERGLTIDADPEQMFRVLLNIVRNSHEALQSRVPNDPVRDQIRVVGRREGAVVVLEIADTGPGIPPRAREHLFQPFQGSVRSGGTGLGLAIAAEIVRLHGGEIKLVDGTLGATFHITIPDRPVELEDFRSGRLRA
ncbi:MAG: HAMP domain-containing histidine kinase [Xanthobacteraceae bacterium]|nr:HAMP domain-containing histidine kinase [Xanthobacteraceae bacterium]QYK45317.1 MAG: HAMP domain-containing histidine kinase [Xanthobacteraceae bacterium]